MPCSNSSVQSMSSADERNDWMATTCANTLQLIVDIFTQYFTTLQPILIGDVFALLKWCILSDNEQLVLAGANTATRHDFT